MPTWTGEIGEIIAVGTTIEREKIEGYLAHKWGLTSSLPTSHPYKSSQPTGNGSTSNDVIVSGASVSSVSGSGATYTLNLQPHTNPSRIRITIREGAAVSSANGERNQRSTKEILFRPSVMKESNLALFFPLGEEEDATTVYDWGPHGLTGSVQGSPERHPGRTGSAFRFDGSANKKITIPNHRAMRMTNNGQYTLNTWIRYEIGSTSWTAIINRNGRNYYFSFGDAANANGGYIHHRFRMGTNANDGVPNAYRVSPGAWTMVTLTNEGNGGIAKTYIDGGLVQSKNLTSDIFVENLSTDLCCRQ